MTHVWLQTNLTDGQLVAQDYAYVSVFDHGFTVGDGVFETIKTVHGVPFALKEHLQRLAQSASMLRILPPDETLIRHALREVVAQPEVKRSEVGRLRITWTAGVGPLGSERLNNWTLVVAWTPAKPWAATTTIQQVPITRNEQSPLSGAKTTSYAENALALAMAKQNGADEALLLNTAGNVCECASSNIFLVKAGVLLTPSLDQGCLSGVTRNIVIEIARTVCEVKEQVISYEELLVADEVFITSSTRDIQPVAQVDGQRYSAPGFLTQLLIEEFALHVKEYLGD